MNIAITGANGLVGSAVTKLLIKEGHQISAIKRSHSDLSLLKGIENQIEWHETDILDSSGIYKAFAGADAVVHCAAVVSYDPKDEEAIFRVNVSGTANVVNACSEIGIKRLVHISSVAALGRESKHSNIDESAQWKESPLNTVYARSKHLAELEVLRGEAEGLNTATLNPSLILGAGDMNSSSTRLFKYAFDGSSLYPEGDVNYVDVEDVSQAVKILMDETGKKGRYILNGGNVPYLELFTLMAKNFKTQAPKIKVPARLTKILWPIEHLRSKITGRPPLITRETAMLSSQHVKFDNTRATKELGITFTSLEETLDRVCQQLLERNRK